MRNSIKSSCSIILSMIVVAIIVIPVNNASAQTGAVSLDHTVGRLGLSDSIACGQPIEFYIRITNNTGNTVSAVSIPSLFYSPDGATWSSFYLDTIPLGWRDMFDGVHYVTYNSMNGAGADSACFAGWRIFSPGMPNGFDSVSLIATTQVDCSQVGKTVCLDADLVLGSRGHDCVLLWATTGGAVVPTWDGPHCFTIVNCCSGRRGDLNYDGSSANIVDLSFLVDYIFRGSNKPGDCIESRDVNGDGDGPNIVDLSFLVDFIFRGGPPPDACP